jgi:hypothetical protein
VGWKVSRAKKDASDLRNSLNTHGEHTRDKHSKQTNRTPNKKRKTKKMGKATGQIVFSAVLLLVVTMFVGLLIVALVSTENANQARQCTSIQFSQNPPRQTLNMSVNNGNNGNPVRPWCISTRYRLRDPLFGLSDPSTWESSQNQTDPVFRVQSQLQVQRQTGSEDTAWTIIEPEFFSRSSQLYFVDRDNPCREFWSPTKPRIPPVPDPQAPEIDARGFSWRSAGGIVWCLATRYRYRYLNGASLIGPWSDWSGLWESTRAQPFCFPMFSLVASAAPRTQYQPAIFPVETAQRATFRLRTMWLGNEDLIRQVRLPRTGVWSADSAAEALTLAFANDGFASEQTILIRFDAPTGRMALFATGRGQQVLQGAQVESNANASLGEIFGFPNGQNGPSNTWILAQYEPRYTDSFVREATLPVTTDNDNQGCP